MGIKDVSYYVNGLQNGQTILYPTDTVWGLGCDAFNKEAVLKIYNIKKRDPSKPFILLVDSVKRLKKYVVEVHPRIENLLHYYRKPITIIYKASDLVPNFLITDEGTIAIRLVDQKFCIDLIQKLGSPLVSTSANVQGEPTPNSFDQISSEILSSVDLIADRAFETHKEAQPSVLVRYNEDGELIFLRS